MAHPPGFDPIPLEDYDALLLSTKEQFDKYWPKAKGLVEKCIKRSMHGEITVDAHKLSRWAKRKDDIEFTTELQMARNFIDNLRMTFPKAKIFFKVGNHEDRLEHFIQEKADQFAGIITWQSLLELDKKGIKFVDSNQLMFCHGTWIAHGHEIKVNGGANPAVALMNKTLTNANSYTDTAISGVNTTINNLTTDDIAEGANEYFTTLFVPALLVNVNEPPFVNTSPT